MGAEDRIIVALDVPRLDEAVGFVELLRDDVGCFKLSLELLTNEGAPKVVRAIKKAGGKIFYDGKFKDIPNTVAGAARVVTELGVDMFSVHCLGGSAMMKTACQAAEEVSKERGIPRPLIFGVTILTSLNYDDLVEMGIFEELNIADPEELAQVKCGRLEKLVAHDLAWLAQESGLDGVIASPQEIRAIRKYCQPEFLVVTPGIRPLWAATDDQKRIMTPTEAIKAGANYLVIGRPITRPPAEIRNPVNAAKMIAREIVAAM